MTEIAENIAQIKTDVEWLKEAMKKHISHHFQVRLALIGSLIAAGTAILIAVL